MLNYLAAAVENRVTYCEPGFLALVLVLIGSGLLGGLVAFFADPPAPARGIQEAKENEARINNQHIAARCLCNRGAISFARHMMLGLAASLVVPLFLNTISSSLVDDAIKGGEGAKGSLLVIMGFCIIAAVSSQRFIGSLTDSVIRDFRRDLQRKEEEISEAKEGVAEVRQGIAEAKDIAVEAKDLASTETEPETDDSESVGTRNKITMYSVDGLSEEENRVISAIKSMTYKSRASRGIARDLDMIESDVIDILGRLAAKGVAIKKGTPKNFVRWSLTDTADENARPCELEIPGPEQ
jgi:hypothetical protein